MTSVPATLYTLCYPRLIAADRRFIDEFRREHDILFRDVVAPHFTLAFACSDVPLPVYRNHLAAIAQSQRVIEFSCHYAMTVKDHFSENYCTFLVPDEGYSEISKLHDRVHTGPLSSFLRLDIPYIPHIGIATIPNATRIKRLCDELNSAGIAIHGQIDAMTLCSYDGAKITDLEIFPLQS